MNAVRKPGPFRVDMPPRPTPAARTQEDAFRVSLDQVKTFMGNEAQVLAVAASRELRASLVNRQDLPPLEIPGAATLATPPAIAQVLSLSSQNAPGNVDEGGCVFITGKNFGKRPGTVRLTFHAIKEFAPQQDIAVELTHQRPDGELDETPSIAGFRTSGSKLPSNLSNDPAPRLAVSFGPDQRAHGYPCHLSRRGLDER
jgi:hypothetical protein